MVGVIFDASQNPDHAVWYNERKVSSASGIRESISEVTEDDTHLLVAMNVPEGNTILDEFERLEELNEGMRRGRHMRNPGFHLTINPGPNDAPLSEAQAVELAVSIMNDLGYGDVPFAIYKHDDIKRVHYHIASIRIGQDGKKISDSFEEKNLQKILWRYAKKYGYAVGNQESPEESEKEADSEVLKKKDGKKSMPEEKPAPGERKPQKKRKSVPAFDRSSETPVTAQFKDIVDDALLWNFSTPEQFMLLLRRRYMVECIEWGNDFALIGSDRNDKSKTPPVTGAELGIEIRERVDRRCSNNDRKKLKKERERMEKAIKEEAVEASSLKDLQSRLALKHIFMSVAWSRTGDAFGLTWIDGRSRCIWKGSETDVTLPWLKETCSVKGWELKPAGPVHPKHRPTSPRPDARPLAVSPKDNMGEGSIGSLDPHNKRITSDNSLSDDIYRDETKQRMNATTIIRNEQ